MVRRGRSSASRGVQRNASLLVLAVLAGTCSIVSCFIVPAAAPVPVSRRRPADTSAISSATARHGTSSMLEGTRGVARRQRSPCLSAAGARGGEGEISGAGAALDAAAAAAAAADPLLSSQSTAPARTEIPTDVAVVGAPQQVGSGHATIVCAVIPLCVCGASLSSWSEQTKTSLKGTL